MSEDAKKLDDIDKDIPCFIEAMESQDAQALITIREEIAQLVRRAAEITRRPDDEDWIVASRKMLGWDGQSDSERSLATEICLLLDPNGLLLDSDTDVVALYLRQKNGA